MKHVRLTFAPVAAAILVVACAAPLGAQQRDKQPDETDGVYRDLVTKLDEQSQQLADEYLDVLEQLQEVIEDYQMYLEDLDDTHRKEQEVSIQVLTEGLRTRKYAAGPEELLDDIGGVIENIKRIEAEQKAKYNTNNPASTRVIRNLRKELVMIADMAEDYSDKQVKSVFSRKETQAYLQQSMKAAAKALAEQFGSRKATTRTGKEPRTDETPGAIFVVPGTISPPQPVPPVAPVPPTAPVVTLPPGWMSGESLGTGYVRSFEDSISVSSHDRIIISNPTGGLQISGDGDNDLVTVQLGVEVSAKTREQEKKFIAATSLQVKRIPGGCEIAAVFPSIRDAETRLLRSVLVVSVPGPNPVECSNAFGEVQISELSGDVTLSTSYSPVTITGIEGAVTAVSSMGAVVVDNVSGPVSVSNAYSSIQVSECRGRISVTGSYSPIELDDNSGPATITNTASVTVQNHEGTLVIDNTYGAVDINNVVGNITVSNAYQAITVSEITGTAELSNIYSSIDASSVSEKLILANKYGNVSAEYLGGPIDVTCERGTIDIVLDDDFSGSSNIKTSGGQIDLSIEGEPDLTISALTTGGRTSSELTHRVDGDNAEWRFGGGRNALRIVSSGTSLTVSRKP